MKGGARLSNAKFPMSDAFARVKNALVAQKTRVKKGRIVRCK